MRESADDALLRWKKLELLQEEYASFAVFLEEAMEHLGFSTSPVQQDIGSFLEHGPQHIMVQAQRGQAKTTIAAIFAVWSLIHDPKHRVLILSAGGTLASAISKLIVQLIMTMDGLEPLHPDASNGDRTSSEGFDVHYTLKGVDKSPSVACIGITGNLQGFRADLLIPDDIESKKNSNSATAREWLLELSRDFSSICTDGRILYLGTPQSQDSVYNSLPGRGYTVRIWPGRYPNAEQMENYGDMLAPFVRNRIKMNPGLAFGGGMLKDQGQPVDPSYINEATLQFKENDQGPTYFQLQHMLNTKLADALRFPLKLENLISMKVGGDYYPLNVVRGFGGKSLVPYSVNNVNFNLNTAIPQENQDVGKLQGIIMYVDPAGGGKNGDETAYAVTGFLNGNIFLLSVGGVPGGYSVPVMEKLADIAAKWKVTKVIVEKNMGYGGFVAVWLPILRAKHMCAVEDDMVHGQKELRIIETLEPVMARGSLIINEDAISEDRDTSAAHEPAKRSLYSLFHQLSKMTRDRGCLFHDDRADALEGAVRHWVAMLAIDQSKAVEAARKREHEAFLKDPLGKLNQSSRGPMRGGGSLIQKYLRR